MRQRWELPVFVGALRRTLPPLERSALTSPAYPWLARFTEAAREAEFDGDHRCCGPGDSAHRRQPGHQLAQMLRGSGDAVLDRLVEPAQALLSVLDLAQVIEHDGVVRSMIEAHGG